MGFRGAGATESRYVVLCSEACVQAARSGVLVCGVLPQSDKLLVTQSFKVFPFFVRNAKVHHRAHNSRRGTQCCISSPTLSL
jgi:hypothetical protein